MKDITLFARGMVTENSSQDDYRIVQFSKPSPDFDVSKAGRLKIPESQGMLYDTCLRLHF
jgi:hypothetical protein